MNTQAPWLLTLALPLLLSTSSGARRPADPGVRCSKSELPSHQPSLFFVGRAVATLVRTRRCMTSGAADEQLESDAKLPNMI